MSDHAAAPSAAIAELAEAVRACGVAVALLDLATSEIVAASAAGAELFGVSTPAGHDVLEFVADVPTARTALEQVRSGMFDAYAASRQLKRGDGALVDVALWVRAFGDELPRPYAIVAFAPSDDAGETRPVPAGGPMVGRVDAGERIAHVSEEVRELLGYAPTHCVGRKLVDLVHPDDVDAASRVIRLAADNDTSSGNNVRVSRSDGKWRDVYLAASPVGTPDEVGFAALGSDHADDAAPHEQTDRVAELERHLTRIAREVEAAGLIGRHAHIVDPERLPALGDLTPRQWDIVTRLLRGERVPTIARALYISPSTVRNYLSSLYRKLGVHSQAELIEKLQKANDPATT